MRFENLRTRCLFCDHVSADAFNSADRMCRRTGCASHTVIPTDQTDFYVSTIPEFRGDLPKQTPSIEEIEMKIGAAEPLANGRPNPAQLPPIDGHLGVADTFALDSTEPRQNGHQYEGWRIEYPYKRDILDEDFGLKCGNPILLNIGTQLGIEVDVLDFSTHYISRTMKDPRSWSIVNLALEKGIRHLALWTAGNAGLSLARLVYMVNHRLPPEKRIQVYCIVKADLDPNILCQLEQWQAYVVIDHTSRDDYSPILKEDDVWQMIASNLSKKPAPEERWHVTDGWDGVGILNYYQVALQVLTASLVDSTTVGKEAEQQYDAAIIPVGSGDMFMGFYLASVDGFHRDRRPKMFAAVPPAGRNIFSGVREETTRTRPSAAGKLEGDYTPLAYALRHLESNGKIGKLEIDDPTHRLGVSILRGIQPHCPFPFEPSAALAFSAVQKYRQIRPPRGRHGALNLKKRILVVSSGSGLMPNSETMWLRKYWFGQG